MRRLLLLLQDDSLYARLTDLLLREAPELVLETVTHAEAARRRLGEAHFDALLLELDSRRADALREITELPDAPPVVVLTTPGEDENALLPLRHGAQDVVLLDEIDGPRLLLRLRAAIERARSQAVRMRRERLTALGTLAAGMAHAINNPLTAVLTNLSLLEDMLGPETGTPPSEVGDEATEMLRDAREGALRIRHVVRELTTFGRLVPATSLGIDLVAALDRALCAVEDDLRDRARVVKRYACRPRAHGTEGLLEQLFVNVLRNAAQAMAGGALDENELGLHVFVADDRACVEVTDTGPGVPPEALPRVFDPFFTSKEIGEGAGLGLAVCHGIVVMLGGEIELENREDRGAVIRLRLPLAEAEALREHATSIVTWD